MRGPSSVGAEVRPREVGTHVERASSALVVCEIARRRDEAQFAA